MAYPTWKRISTKLIVSEEQQEGTPDYYVERDAGQWYVKARFSANYYGPFKTAAAAMRSVDEEKR